ncbi:helix-turn-helix domain-containing protein [Rhodobacter sp. Har01]|nr:helix-turn-helix domain-containing protein [Rhodobacter sp. Har01]MCB6178578.1 helix-turn-helix domain-containing protein [Rhodobacter sp. Har01]
MGPARVEDGQYLRVYIRQLRRQLGDAVNPHRIFTEKGVGYRLAER